MSQGGYALFADDDVERASQHCWHVTAKGYAKTNVVIEGRATTLYLHRLIAPPPPGMVCDPVNGVRLDCRKCNLRHCRQGQNILNRMRQANSSSPYKGVLLATDRGRRRVYISLGGRQSHLADDVDPADGAYVYDQCARQ